MASILHHAYSCSGVLHKACFDIDAHNLHVRICCETIRSEVENSVNDGANPGSLLNVPPLIFCIALSELPGKIGTAYAYGILPQTTTTQSAFVIH